MVYVFSVIRVWLFFIVWLGIWDDECESYKRCRGEGK